MLSRVLVSLSLISTLFCYGCGKTPAGYLGSDAKCRISVVENGSIAKSWNHCTMVGNDFHTVEFLDSLGRSVSIPRNMAVIETE